MTDALTLEHLCVQAGNRTLLDDAKLSFPDGKITVLVGGSGAGKSVLLRVLAGILPRHGASIRWSGDLHWKGNPVDPSSMPRTGIVFQQFALFDELSPSANVQFAIDHRNGLDESPQHSPAEWLDFLGVPATTPVSALSGGQKQRLAIARTLASSPEIILYDEPTSGLDAATGRRVADLIRETQSRFGRTSIVVTHDYETLLPIADEVLLFDSAGQTIRRVERDDWAEVPEQMEAVALAPSQTQSSRETTASSPLAMFRRSAERFFDSTGKSVIAAVQLPWDARPVVPSWKWAGRFLAHYLRLVGGPSAWLYLIIAGLIAGFTTTYFTLRFLPFRLYTQPLLIDELLSSIGFALYRILVPVLATVLIAARCGAAVAADVGVKQYGGQVDALRTLGVRAPAYLLIPILAAFLIATPILEWIAFTASHWISRVTFAFSHPEIGVHFWQQHFFRAIIPEDGAGIFSSLGLTTWKGWDWVLAKNLLCGFGTAAIGYHQGITPKHSASDVSHCITTTVLWTTLYVLVVHFIIALLEF
ncbi:ABC transporter permease [Rhodopirellula sp. JC740]|uniref:ABC transporter permease n=1 Tax=Rhodopirellula halodulae TaxID=2894198 RepID=A0ABS8NMH1_9BACT|nr:ABC transporter permease [Rhodopirellula sp. JC740]MCC9644755.1 ABC transporter permease [Rhodopirellula sp. JC740]